METEMILLRHWRKSDAEALYKCGFVATGKACIDENQYQGKDRPIRVLRLELQ